jgi:hypothetical protein
MLSTTPSDGDYSFVFTSRDVQVLHGCWPSGLVGSLEGWYKHEISKKPINKIARGQIWRASSLLQIAPYWSETPVLRFVALPVCLNVVTHVTIDFWFGTRPNIEASWKGCDHRISVWKVDHDGKRRVSISTLPTMEVVLTGGGIPYSPTPSML